MTQPKRAKRARPPVRVKGADGNWRDLPIDRKSSDDPEIEELWELPIVELEKILDDPTHRLHQKALVVTAQAFAPLQAAVQQIQSTIEPMASLSESLLPHVPRIDDSWISDLVLEYPAWQDFRRSLTKTDEPMVVHSIDFDSPTPPDASLDEVAAAVPDVALIVLHEIAANGRDQLEQMRADSASSEEALEVARDSLSIANESLTVARDSRDAAKGSRTAGWWAAGAAIAAAVIGIVGIVVTIAIASN